MQRVRNDYALPWGPILSTLYLCSFNNVDCTCIPNDTYGGGLLSAFSMSAMNQVWNCYKRMNRNVVLQVGLHLLKNF